MALYLVFWGIVKNGRNFPNGTINECNASALKIPLFRTAEKASVSQAFLGVAKSSRDFPKGRKKVCGQHNLKIGIFLTP